MRSYSCTAVALSNKLPHTNSLSRRIHNRVATFWPAYWSYEKLSTRGTLGNRFKFRRLDARPFDYSAINNLDGKFGLYRSILPKFERETKIRVHVVAVGTGQAIRNARNGDGDVLLVHAKEDEQNFVDAGYGTERLDVMYNDFVIVGPPDDPAAIASMTSALRALAKIAKKRVVFASRGDDSAPTRKSWNFGGKPVLIRHPIAGNGIARRDRAWEQH